MTRVILRISRTDPPRVVLENGPKQDCACEMRLMPRPEGFVQFYLGTWLHR